MYFIKALSKICFDLKFINCCVKPFKFKSHRHIRFLNHNKDQMKHIFGDSSKRSSNSSVLTWQNKQNLFEAFKDEKDICKILAHFEKLIQSNNQAISQLRNEFTARATNGSFSKDSIPSTFNDQQQPSYCHGPDNSLNQTYQTVSSKQYRSSLQLNPFKNSVNVLNQKLEQIQLQVLQMKRSETQNSFNLQKRFSEKGDKTEIEKALNLSKLLVVEINQIQDRFKENQKIAKLHEDKINFLQQTLTKMDQKFNSQTQLLNKKINEQNSPKDETLTQNYVLNSSLVKNFDTKLERLEKSCQQNVQNITRKMHEQYEQKFVGKISQIYTRLVNLESQQEENISKNQSFSNEIKLELHNISQENKKLGQKMKKETQMQLSKKFDSLDKLYIKKSVYLKERQEYEAELQKLSENISKMQSSLISRMEKMQKSHHSLQFVVQNHNSNLLAKITNLSQDYLDKLAQARHQIQKTLSKYSKTDTIKQLIESQNQKIYQTINKNLEQQKQVNSVLCSQNILGRWLWQNQELKNGNLISWDKEIINTLPQNFRFSNEKQKSTLIEISSGGIYKFELGFYSKKKPTIQVLINGKVVMSAVNSSSYVIHHSSGKLKGIQPTEIAGLTLVDFFLIPENSRIAIAYSGDVRGQGFLNIHRL